MKRFILAAVLVLALVFATACGSAEPDSNESEGTDGDGGSGKLLTGFALTSTVEKSADAGVGEGLAQADSEAVGVLVDENGVIVKCVIDSVQTKIGFSADGKLLTSIDTIVPTKIELGNDYGLHAQSSLGTDWGDQIQAFCSYVEGKTLEEVKGISVNETTAPTDEELSASVTIKIGNYISGIEKAVGNAVARGAMAGDTLGLGIDTNISKSIDAAADQDGLAQAYSTYVLASFDASGKVTSCVIDGSQCNVNFNATGVITSDLTAVQASKNELGEAYGMKEKSSIGKEWSEQAASYADYAIGKTTDELAGISVTEKGAPKDAELAATVTVSVGNFNNCMKKAFDTSK